jgi:hypothetical protein
MPSKVLYVVAGPMLVFALFCVYKIGSNLWNYNRMRVMPVEVVSSSLFVDADAERYPFFVLRLDLRSTDANDRRIRWDEEISQAFYIEEAYDELRRWAPGTRHNVQFLRGQAREIRIEVSGVNPELQAAGGWTFGAGFALMIGIPLLGMAVPEDSRMRRLGLHKYVGPWLALSVFGFFPLIGAAAFAIVETPKRFQWKAVDGVPVSRKDLPPAPPNVEITAQVKPILEEKKAPFFVRHEWNGRVFHGGLGEHNGPYEELYSTCEISQKSCRFYVSPTNRWEIKRAMAFDKEYWAPLGILSFFGVAFTGAGLLVRKLMGSGSF